VKLRFISERLVHLLCTLYSFFAHEEESRIMSFFKKLKSEFEEMFGDDDKKKEEKPTQPAHDTKPTESSEFLVMPSVRTYSN
jgi:hypothetical protein